MTLVVSSHTVDGVLMAADCRLTVQRPGGGPPFVADDAMKLISLGDRSCIGYSGDLQTVALLLGQLLSKERRPRRLDPVSIRRWLPRLLGAAYAALDRSYPGQMNQCEFLVGSSLAGRERQVSLRKVLELLARTSSLGHSNILCMRTLKAIMANEEITTVAGSSQGLLFSMKSPDFDPQDYPVLTHAAIGSAAPCARAVFERYESCIFSDSPALVIGWFMEAVATVMAENPDELIGGMFLTAALAHGKRGAFLVSGGGPALVIEQDRFVQVDPENGRRIRLRYPGELLQSPPRTANVFAPYRREPVGWGDLKGRTAPAFVTPELRAEMERQGVVAQEGS